MTAPKKLTLRRVATFFAAVGMLVMSSGVALMVAATPANAVSMPVGLCHATNSDTNPYVYRVVGDESLTFKAHLAHRNNPPQTWKTAGTFNGKAHTAGQAKPDLIGNYTDDEGNKRTYDGAITAFDCEDAGAPSIQAVADVDFFDPTCAEPTRAEYDTTGEFVVLPFEGAWTPAAPGETRVIKAHALPGTAFADGSKTKTFTHTFGAALDPNAPPCVATATVDFDDPSCANQNQPSYQGSGDNVTFGISSGSEAPGSDIVVTATATGDFKFAGGATTKDFAHTFGEAVDLSAPGCEPVVAPPVVDPPGSTPATPTVVHSGLVSAEDLRGELGLALLVGGMVMMVLAGGVGLGARQARI